MRPRTLSLAAFLVVWTGTAHAHETWLMPSRFSTPATEEVPMDLTSGMEFPLLDQAIRMDRVALAGFRLAGKRTQIQTLRVLDQSLQLIPHFAGEGVAAIWVELHPRTIELNAGQVREYLEEINASDGIRAAWARRPPSESWRETYTKHAKTYVRIGSTAADRSWGDAVGMALEIVPGTDPLDLRVGEKASFRLLRNGKPLANVPVCLIVEGAGKRVFRTTDAQGRVVFLLERAGKLLLSAVDLRRTSVIGSWQSDFTTLVLQVGPE